MASSSSAHNLPQHHLLFPHGATAAPPPTPSSQPTVLDSPSDSTVDALASLLHRLPTTLSLPSSRFSRLKSSSTTNTTKVDAPSISLSNPRSQILSAIASAASDHGFFQLTHHRLTTQLAESAESDSVNLLALSLDQKRRLFPSNWPVGFEDDEDDQKASLCSDIDSLVTIKPPELSVASLIEFTTALESLGVELVEMLTCALSLDNPVRANEPEKRSSLMWVSKFDQNSKTTVKRYPYAIGLRFQNRSQECRLETDTGPVLVNPEVGSVLVTLGDVAQVWSNGRTKKVRGRPFPTTDKDSITMSLLVTVPLDSTISPLLPATQLNDAVDLKKAEVDDNQVLEGEKMVFKFNSISFEDYAWRVYHERLFLKDSLDRYRILSD